MPTEAWHKLEMAAANALDAESPQDWAHAKAVLEAALEELAGEQETYFGNLA